MVTGEVAPIRKAEGIESALILVDDLGVAGAKQGDGALHTADVNGLPEAVQH